MAAGGQPPGSGQGENFFVTQRAGSDAPGAWAAHVQKRALAAGAWARRGLSGRRHPRAIRERRGQRLFPPIRASLADIEHVVILMQENRSFDQLLRIPVQGARVFGPLAHARLSALSVFPTTRCGSGAEPVAPTLCAAVASRLQDHQQANAEDLSHGFWSVQHLSWNEGLMDRFVTSHRLADDVLDRLPEGDPGDQLWTADHGVLHP